MGAVTTGEVEVISEAIVLQECREAAVVPEEEGEVSREAAAAEEEEGDADVCAPCLLG